MLHLDDEVDNCLHIVLAVLEKLEAGLGFGFVVVPVPVQEAIEVVYDRARKVGAS